MTIPRPERQHRLAILTTTVVLLAGIRGRGPLGAPNGQTDDDLRAALEADEDGQTGEALALVRQARARKPLDHELAFHEATFLWKLDRMDDALVAYMDAASLAPADDGRAHYWLAVHLTRRGDARAVDYLTQALRREPTLIEDAGQDELWDRWRDDPKYRDAIEIAFHRALTRDDARGN